MIYSVSGTIQKKGEHFSVVEMAGAGLKLHMYKKAIAQLPAVGETAKLFTFLYVREDALELYGFPEERELQFFEQLISVSGVGPKSALAILDIAELVKLQAAIKENRPDLLTRASGIGRKTAERIILELRTKVQATAETEGAVRGMEQDVDLVETLVELGYKKDQARAALGKLDPALTKLEDRLKAALKILAGR